MMDAAYDIEDIIDLSSTEILRRRSNNPVIDFFTNNPLIFHRKIGTSTQKTFDRLTNIAKEREYHLPLSGRGGVENLSTKMSESISKMGEDVVLGRDLKIILEQLLFKEKTNIEVLVLVGMGGVGKTTLAKLVYNDSQVDVIFGKRKFWVCVSEIFDPSKIIKLVIEQIDGNPCQLEGLQALSKKLKEFLETNMYLLVLDDVCHNLPLNSKFCFVYCSIFPKDSVMRKIELIQQWAGNGFISLNEGNEIFDDLLSRCFFQDVEKDVYGSITTFKMHDLIHDLAESIAKSLQCGILDDSIQDRNLSDRKQVRYLSIILNMGKEEEASYSDISIKLKDARVLRTLQLLSSGIVSKTFLDNCFTKFKFLRVLVCSNLKDIPPSIDNLKLLRYVDFSKTRIKRLPETICNLQNLQTLKLNECFALHILPKKLRKLSELRYLENDGCYYLDSMPDGMDHLSLLQTLNTFVVNDGGKNLNELRHLDHLEESLRIQNLNRIQNVVLENGILNRKSKLVSLELDFECDWEPTKGSDDEKVLQAALQPHSNLKSLYIIKFGGFFIPLDMSSLQSLTSLQILVCPNLTTLSNNMNFLRSLIHLEISYCQNLTSLPNNMGSLQSLTHLEIDCCPSLISLPNDISSLQSLTHLLISDCPKLTTLPNNMGSLQSLTHLEISYCKNLTCLPNSMGSLQSLTHLDISGCKNLTCLPNSMGSLKSLTHLKIYSCENLTTLPNSMSSLTSLTQLILYECPNLTTLPNDMDSLQSLTHLKIYSCPNISRLPDGMEKLEGLIINNCPMLEEYCKRKKTQV
ncbi:NB-ARC domain-containing disease resistance protein [Zostera marina]|uniref:NB-ARC domain-containing disease resistance protein n=1 Tax=Zostera marina TaxID=29655 RepID=A0A0K9NL10_ZOSMR|nr:NB-ARC domain-containing disease resistance protein [Zostera marina]